MKWHGTVCLLDIKLGHVVCHVQCQEIPCLCGNQTDQQHRKKCHRVTMLCMTARQINIFETHSKTCLQWKLPNFFFNKPLYCVFSYTSFPFIGMKLLGCFLLITVGDGNKGFALNTSTQYRHAFATGHMTNDSCPQFNSFYNAVSQLGHSPQWKWADRCSRFFIWLETN